ncbi:MAG: ThuA domain-containing protein [Rhizorhabdus sp.]
MRLTVRRVILWTLLLVLGAFLLAVALNWSTIQRVFLGGVHVYETTPPELPAAISRPAILVFSKTNAFRHEEAIPAANALFAGLAKANGWGLFQTENGATFRPEILARFDAVVFNNVSGDVFKPEQRAAFKAFVERGGGFVGIHAAGDSSHEVWPWYLRMMIGTTFIGHPMDPQFQRATVRVEDKSHPATRALPDAWPRTDEWYSFDKSPRGPEVHVLATLDERTYNPEGMAGQKLAMGEDHPIVWWRCVGRGRVFYSALGHTAASYAEPDYRAMLLGALRWSLRLDGTGCEAAAPPPAGAGR